MMFSREFEHEDVLCIWDSIFAFYSQNQSFEFLDYIALAMIKKVRNKLFKEDDSAMALQIFLKYPKINYTMDLIRSANELKGKV